MEPGLVDVLAHERSLMLEISNQLPFQSLVTCHFLFKRIYGRQACSTHNCTCQIRYKKTNSGWWHVSQCKPGTHLRNQSNIIEGQCRTEIHPFTNPISSILNTFQQQHIELTNNPNNRWRHVGDWVALGDNDN